MRTDKLFNKGERDGMHFQSKKRSGKGVAGFILSVFCIAVFLTLCVVSAIAGGAAGKIVGVMGLMVAAVCVIAFLLSLQGLRERDVFTKLPFVGIVISGGLFVLLFCLYVVGIQI
ncbi:MAG: DUF6142 family protein [Lachnospiraceae bacterium]|nr:DUF6142 family protein [Lachnospiraceae bacterium]